MECNQKTQKSVKTIKTKALPASKNEGMKNETLELLLLVACVIMSMFCIKGYVDFSLFKKTKKNTNK